MSGAYVLSAATSGVISLILVLGLNIQWGWAGQLNLSYYAFVALGAYLTGTFNLPSHQPDMQYILGLNLPFLPSLILSTIVCAAVGGVVGALLHRHLEGYYFAIGTVSLAYIFNTVVQQTPTLFNGAVGLYGLGQPFNTYLNLGFNSYATFYFGMCTLLLAAVYCVTSLLQRSPFGRALRTTREDPIAAAMFGYNVYALRIKAFVVASAIAGLGGGLLIFYVGAFNPADWGTLEVIVLLAAIMVGGSGNNLGVLIGGALLLSVLPQALLNIPGMDTHPAVIAPLRVVIIGVAIILTVWLRPNGLVPEKRVTAP